MKYKMFRKKYTLIIIIPPLTSRYKKLIVRVVLPTKHWNKLNSNNSNKIYNRKKITMWLMKKTLIKKKYYHHKINKMKI